EILKAIEYFEPWIWHELHTHYGRIISKETIDEIMADDKPPNNVTDKDSLGLILTLLTAEALKQDFDNVLIYVRFLRECYLDFDDETGKSRLRKPEEQERVKRMLHIQFRLYRKWGIYVSEADSTSTRVWQVPKPKSNFLWRMLGFS
ncbi:unnamed protein product, partial [Meganyctiphanes norvegica]